MTLSQRKTREVNRCLTAALGYRRRGWAPIPVRPRDKRPEGNAWQKLRLTEQDIPSYFKDGQNVGVLLGEPSKNLTDIDLDALEAVELADAFLPETDTVFGRRGKPHSHREYVVDPLLDTERFKDTDGEVLVEIRSTGGQTVFPPSTHPSGDQITWESDGDPAEIDGPTLRSHVARLAAAALLVRHWPAEGSRQDVALALAGGLLRGEWEEEEVSEFIGIVAEAAGDEETEKRAKAAGFTARTLAQDRPTTGWPRLAELLDEKVVERACDWLGIQRERRSHHADDRVVNLQAALDQFSGLEVEEKPRAMARIFDRLAAMSEEERLVWRENVETQLNIKRTDFNRLLKEAQAREQATAQALPATTEILEGVPRLARPLTVVDGVTHAAVWLRLRESRGGQQTDVERLCVVRWDGSEAKLFGPAEAPLTELGIEIDLPFQPEPQKLWSPKGVQAFLKGYRAKPSEVFRQIRAVVDRFIDFDLSLGSQEKMCALVAVFIMATYFLDAFTVVGYMWPTGDMGCGKTHLLTILAQLSYIGRLVLSGGSYASLRDEAHYGATLCFDDAEQVASKGYDPDKRALFLAGNRQGVTVTVKEPTADGGWRTRHFNAFCPRAFSAIRLPDRVLASRSIAIPLARTADPYRANADPLEEALWPHDRRRLLDDLWNIGVVYEARVGELFRRSSQGELLGRQFEPWRWLFAVATLIEEDGEKGLVATFRQLSERYQEERPDLEFDDGKTTIVIRALRGILGSRSEWETTAAAVAERAHLIAKEEGLAGDDKLFMSSRQVGSTLNRLRVPKGKRQGKLRPRMIDRTLIQKLVAAYGLSAEEEESASKSKYVRLADCDDVTCDDNNDEQYGGVEEKSSPKPKNRQSPKKRSSQSSSHVISSHEEDLITDEEIATDEDFSKL